MEFQSNFNGISLEFQKYFIGSLTVDGAIDVANGVLNVYIILFLS